MQRLPLEERLRSAGASDSICPATAWSFVDGFFKNLSEMSLDNSYMEYYMDTLQDETIFGDIHNTFFAQAVHSALTGIYPPVAASELLYQMLIKPFADKNIFNTEGENK